MLDENKQLVTTDYAALKAWCLTQPAPKQHALKAFIAYLSQERTAHNLKYKTKTPFYKSRSSYGLKHVVERLSDALGDHEYVSNENFIVAMLQAGFRIQNECEKNRGEYRYMLSPNYLFDIKPIKIEKELVSLIAQGVREGKY